MANKHHHEGTGKFKSTADVKGFRARPVLPSSHATPNVTQAPGSHTATLPAPKTPKK